MSPVPICCPRCGYDVHAVIDRWEDSCPLLGTCAECGLEYRWGEVIAPHKFEPRWCVEFEPRWWRVAMAGFKTAVRSLWPWRFWSDLKMSYPVRRGRLVAYVAWLLVPLLALYVVMQASVAVVVRYKIARQSQAMIQQGMASMQQQLANLDSLAAFADAPAERREQIRQLMQFNLASLQAVAGTPSTISISHGGAILEAVLLPLAGSSSGVIVDPWGNPSPYPAPRDLYIAAASSSRGGLGSQPILFMAGMMTAGTLGLVLLPLAMVLLPISRRRAHVRWSHIGRVFVYSLIIPVALAACVGPLVLAGVFLRGLVELLGGAAYLLSLAGPWLALVTWWAVAIKRYLRMPHGLAVAVLLGIVCWLVIVAVATLWATF